jgi:hypothetical protein
MLWKIFCQVSLIMVSLLFLLTDKLVQEKHSLLTKLLNIPLTTYLKLPKITTIPNLWCQPSKFMAVSAWIYSTTKKNCKSSRTSIM